MQSTIFTPSDNLKIVESGYLLFLEPEDEDTHAEAVIYQDGDDNAFYVGWDLSMVGLVTYVGAFETVEECRSWLEEDNFEYFGG